MPSLRSLVLVGVTFALGCGGETAEESPPPACLAPGETRALATIDGFSPNTVATAGTALFFGGNLMGGADPFAVGLFRLELGTNGPVQIENHGYGKFATAGSPNGSFVYITAVTSVLSDTAAGRSPNGIMFHDARSGRTFPIVEPGSAFLEDTLQVDDNGVSYIVQARGAEAPQLFRWDAATGTSRLLGETSCCGKLAADERDVFHVERTGDESRVVATSIADGTRRVLLTETHDEGYFTVVAVDDTSLYLKTPNDGGLLVVVSKADGGVTRTMLGADFSPVVPGWAQDGRYLYWADQKNGFSDGEVIRLDLQTGARSVLATDARLLPGVGVDGCNVYFAASNTIYGRGKDVR